MFFGEKFNRSTEACALLMQVERCGWGGRRELNPQRPEPQSGALPVELLPPQIFDYSNSVEGLLGMENCDTARL